MQRQYHSCALSTAVLLSLIMVNSTCSANAVEFCNDCQTLSEEVNMLQHNLQSNRRSQKAVGGLAAEHLHDTASRTDKRTSKASDQASHTTKKLEVLNILVLFIFSFGCLFGMISFGIYYLYLRPRRLAQADHAVFRAMQPARFNAPEPPADQSKTSARYAIYEKSFTTGGVQVWDNKWNKRPLTGSALPVKLNPSQPQGGMSPGDRIQAYYMGDWFEGTLKKAPDECDGTWGVHCDGDPAGLLTFTKNVKCAEAADARVPKQMNIGAMKKGKPSGK